VIKNNTEHHLDEGFVCRVGELALDYLEEVRKDFSVYFVYGKEIKKLNKEYFGSNKETDILSFPSEFTLSDYLGELIINLDLISEKKQQEQRDEIVYLIAHGVLHLLGYDHINTKEGEYMRVKEMALIKRILEVLN